MRQHSTSKHDPGARPWGRALVAIALMLISTVWMGCDFSSEAMCRTPPVPAVTPPPAHETPREEADRLVTIRRHDPQAVTVQTPSLESPAPLRILKIDPPLVAVTPTYVAGAPVAKLKPVNLDIDAVPPAVMGVRIEMDALPAKSALGEFVVAMARVIGPDGKPIPDAEVEWVVERHGVGNIVRLGGHEEKAPLADDRSIIFARCRASVTSYRLGDASEGVRPFTIQPGDAWCILESHTPGDMFLAVRSPSIPSADQSEMGRRVHWHEAALASEANIAAARGCDARVSARVSNPSGEPLAGYSVRWEMENGSPSSFVPSGQSMESVSDAAGDVSAVVKAPSEYPASCRVRARLFGKAVLPGPPTELANSVTEIRWDAEPAALEVVAPASAPVGSPVTLLATRRAESKELGDANVIAIVGRDVEVLNHFPTRSDDSGIQFALAQPPGDSHKGLEITLTSKEVGDRRVRFELRRQETLLAARDVMIRFVEPVLAVEKHFPDEWRVGSAQNYRVIVRNVGETPAEGVRVEDEIPPGLRIDKTDGVEFMDRIQWDLGRLEPGQAREWTVSATPERSFRRLALRAWAVGSLAKRVEGYDLLDVADEPRLMESPKGQETVELSIEDVIDPAPVGGKAVYVVVLTNRGSAAARDIRLSAKLSRHLAVESAEGSLASTLKGGEILFAPVRELASGEQLFCRINAKAVEGGDARIVLQVIHPAVGEQGLARQESTQVHGP